MIIILISFLGCKIDKSHFELYHRIPKEIAIDFINNVEDIDDYYKVYLKFEKPVSIDSTSLLQLNNIKFDDVIKSLRTKKL